MFEVGTVVDGKYRIDRELGRGGMGVVVAATHLTLGTRVALKCMSERLESNDVSVERFLREARAAAQVHSEHICRVLDVGDHEGMPYIVMEMLEGTDLGRVVRKGRLDIAIAVDYVCQACAGLAKAHASQIVHRDLKPENLFLARRDDGPPIVKLLDFGVAKAPDRKLLTDTQQMIGSPAYMSPEQILSSRNVDTRSDVWSLGVILYRLIAGRLPFTAVGVAELMLQICEQEMPPIDGAPPDLVAIVARCLDKAPANRFASVDELALALRPFSTEVRDTTVYTTAPQRVTVEDLTVPDTHTPDDSTTCEQLHETVEAETTPAVARATRRHRWFAATGLAIAAIGAVVAWWLVRDEPASPPAALAPAAEPPRPVQAPAALAPVTKPGPEPAAPLPEPTASEPAPPAGTTLKPKHPGAKPRPEPRSGEPKRPSDEEISRSRI